MIGTQPAMTEDFALRGKPDDELLLRAPLLMHFYRAAVDKIDTLHDGPFLKDAVPLLKIKGFTSGGDGRYPFGLTLAAKKTAFKITVAGFLLHSAK